MNAGQSLSPAAGPGRNAQNPGDGGCCVRDQKAVTIHAEAVTAEEVLRGAWFDLRFAYVGDDPEPKILVMGTEMTRLCAEAVVLDLSESKATPS